MLTVAKTKEGQLIQASEAKKGNDYYCPRCGKIVHVRKTRFQCSFYHIHTVQHASLNEGSFHKMAKALLLDWAKENQVMASDEVVLGKQRADLLWQHTVIEIQQSAITSAELTKRHFGYRQLGYRDVWLAGPRFYYRQSRFNAQLIQYNQRYGFHLWEIHPATKQLKLWYHLTSVKSTARCQCFSYYPLTPNPCVKWQLIDTAQIVLHRLKMIERYRRRKDQRLASLINLCYGNHYPFWEVIEWLLLPVAVPYPNLLQELEWKLFLVGQKNGWQLSEPYNPCPLVSQQLTVLEHSFLQQLQQQGQRNFNFQRKMTACELQRSFL